MQKPLVTVLMAVYNGEKYLKKAIESILEQTYSNVEFLIINDGSTDRSEEIIRSYTDPRIRYVQNERNIGLDATLNYGFKIAQGKYIGRMDCDDISLPDRLEKQIAFLETHQDYAMIGTQYINMDEDGNLYEIGAQLQTYDEIKFGIQSINTFCHGSVMFRKSFLDINNIQYDHTFSPYEDYELWNRLIKITKIANLPEVLYEYRINPTGMSLTQKEEMYGGAIQLGKKLQQTMKLPTLDWNYLAQLYKESEKYRIPTIQVTGKTFPSNFMLAYQTFLYKLGLVFLRRKKVEGIVLLLLSFYLDPNNWFKKFIKNIHG